MDEIRDLCAELRELAPEDPNYEEAKQALVEQICELQSVLTQKWQEYRAAIAELARTERTCPPKVRRPRAGPVRQGRGKRPR